MSYRDVIGIAARVLFGAVAGAVSGFALLTVSFVGFNASPVSSTARIVVLSCALVGAAVMSWRVWRQRPARPVREPSSTSESSRSRILTTRESMALRIGMVVQWRPRATRAGHGGGDAADSLGQPGPELPLLDVA